MFKYKFKNHSIKELLDLSSVTKQMISGLPLRNVDFNGSVKMTRTIESMLFEEYDRFNKWDTDFNKSKTNYYNYEHQVMYFDNILEYEEYSKSVAKNIKKNDDFFNDNYALAGFIRQAIMKSATKTSIKNNTNNSVPTELIKNIKKIFKELKIGFFNGEKNHIYNNITGYLPNVPNYLKNVPQSMFNVKSTIFKNKTIRLFIDIGGNCNACYGYGCNTEPISKSELQTVLIINLIMCQILEDKGYKVNINFYISGCNDYDPIGMTSGLYSYDYAIQYFKRQKWNQKTIVFNIKDFKERFDFKKYFALIENVDLTVFGYPFALLLEDEFFKQNYHDGHRIIHNYIMPNDTFNQFFKNTKNFYRYANKNDELNFKVIKNDNNSKTKLNFENGRFEKQYREFLEENVRYNNAFKNFQDDINKLFPKSKNVFLEQIMNIFRFSQKNKGGFSKDIKSTILYIKQQLNRQLGEHI